MYSKASFIDLSLALEVLVAGDTVLLVASLMFAEDLVVDVVALLGPADGIIDAREQKELTSSKEALALAEMDL